MSTDQPVTHNQAMGWWAKLKAAERMTMVDDARRVLHQDRAQTRSHNQGSGPSEGDDVGDMILGNVEHHHHESPPTEPATSRLGTVAKLALGFGLLGTGAGAGVAIPLLSGGREVIEKVQVQTIDNTRDVVPGFGDPH